MHSDDAFAPVAYLHVDKAHLVDKDTLDVLDLHSLVPDYASFIPQKPVSLILDEQESHVFSSFPFSLGNDQRILSFLFITMYFSCFQAYRRLFCSGKCIPGWIRVVNHL